MEHTSSLTLGGVLCILTVAVAYGGLVCLVLLFSDFVVGQSHHCL